MTSQSVVIEDTRDNQVGFQSLEMLETLNKFKITGHILHDHANLQYQEHLEVPNRLTIIGRLEVIENQNCWSIIKF